MTSRRFPPPWTVIEHAESFWVQDASWQTVGWFYFAPASAERINGGPLKQNGQCWRGHGSASEATWGFWQPCAQPASGSATQRTTECLRVQWRL
jgi:hypothetical protein